MEVYFSTPRVALFLLKGFLVTLEIAILAIAISLVVGLLVTILRLSRVPVVSQLAVAYVDIIRPLPTFLILIVVYFGLARMGVVISALGSAVVGLVLYHATRMAEVIRSGIQSVERGQTQAARSLGLSHIQTMRYITLPIGARRMIPALTTEVLMVVKNTSLTLVIGVSEVMNRAQIIHAKYLNIMETLLIVAILYWLVCYPLSRASQRLEVKDRTSAAL